MKIVGNSLNSWKSNYVIYTLLYFGHFGKQSGLTCNKFPSVNLIYCCKTPVTALFNLISVELHFEIRLEEVTLCIDMTGDLWICEERSVVSYTPANTHSKLIPHFLHLKIDEYRSSSLSGTFLTAGLKCSKYLWDQTDFRGFTWSYTDLTLYRSQIFLKHSQD